MLAYVILRLPCAFTDAYSSTNQTFIYDFLESGSLSKHLSLIKNEARMKEGTDKKKINRRAFFYEEKAYKNKFKGGSENQ